MLLYVVFLICRNKGLRQFWVEIKPNDVLDRMRTWTLPAVFPIVEIKCWGLRFGQDFGLVSAQSIPNASCSERTDNSLAGHSTSLICSRVQPRYDTLNLYPPLQKQGLVDLCENNKSVQCYEKDQHFFYAFSIALLWKSHFKKDDLGGQTFPDDYSLYIACCVMTPWCWFLRMIILKSPAKIKIKSM